MFLLKLPLALLFFALAMQPLMSLLKLEEEGMLQGIPIRESGEQLLFQLFVDNTSLFLESTEDNFKVALDVIMVYERIFGAHLNLEKSTIMQLDEELELYWFQDLGYKIAK